MQRYRSMDFFILQLLVKFCIIRLIKKCVPQAFPYINRHRQAPSTHTDKQAVRTIGGEQCLIILVYTSSAKHPNKIGGFVDRGLFSSIMSHTLLREYDSKLNIFRELSKFRTAFPRICGENTIRQPF